MPGSATSRRILIHGSYLGENYGDLLLMQLFARRIAHLRPDWRIWFPFASTAKAKALGGHEGWPFPRGRVDAVVFAGGGYLSQPGKDTASWSRRNLLRHGAVMHLAMTTGIPSAILGVGIGPLPPSRLRSLTCDLVRRSRICAPRELESLRFLADAAVAPRRGVLQLVVDAVFGLDATWLQPDDLEWSRAQLGDGSRPVVVLHLAPEMSRFSSVYARIRAELQRQGVKTLFVLDSRYRRHVGWLTTVMSDLGLTASDVIAFPGTGRMTALLSQCSGILTSKLHVGIVAAAFQRRVVSLPDHPKTPRFFHLIGWGDRCLAQPDGNHDDVLISRAVAGLTGPVSCAAEWHQAKPMALANWTLLESFLDGIG